MAAFVVDKSCVGAQDDECVAVSSSASPQPPRLLLRRGSPPPQSGSIASGRRRSCLSDREESCSPLPADARQAADASLTEHVYSACRAGDAERLEAILAAAETDGSEEIGGRALAQECCLSPGLVVCCLRGRPRCLALLLAAGADPDASEAPPCVGRAGGFAPLRYACWGTTAGHVECAEMLLAAGTPSPQPPLSRARGSKARRCPLAAGAAVEAATAVGHTPLQGACFKGARGMCAPPPLAAEASFTASCCGQATCPPCGCSPRTAPTAPSSLLPSPRPDLPPTAQLGASRSSLLSDTAESVARRQGHGELAAWLAQSRHWTTPLHHLDSLSLARTRQRNGPSTGAAPIRCRARAACLPLGFSSAPAPRHAPRPRALRTRLRRSPWRGRARARRRRWCHFPLRCFPRTRDTLTLRGIYTRHSGTHRAWPASHVCCHSLV